MVTVTASGPCMTPFDLGSAMEGGTGRAHPLDTAQKTSLYLDGWSTLLVGLRFTRNNGPSLGVTLHRRATRIATSTMIMNKTAVRMRSIKNVPPYARQMWEGKDGR